jgi:hypothetical protein
VFGVNTVAFFSNIGDEEESYRSLLKTFFFFVANIVAGKARAFVC